MKPYVKRQKNDATDAEAICEAVTRANMRFVETKTPAVVTDARDQRVPAVARACFAALGAQLRALKAQILAFDRRMLAWHRSDATSRRLVAIPGIGPALATGSGGKRRRSQGLRSAELLSLDRPRAEAILERR